MTKTKHKCPLCKSSLTKVKFDKVTGIWKLKNVEIAKAKREERDKWREKIKRETKTQVDKALKKQSIQLKKAENSNKMLKKQLDLAKKGKSEADMGFEAEEDLTQKLKKVFIKDDIRRIGKKGDVLHKVQNKQKVIGIIIYERKKTKNHFLSHVTQTQKAKREQKADYAFLVTDGKPTKNFTGYKIEKGVIILRPEAILPFVKIVREQIIETDRLKIPHNKRDQVANRALKYLNSKVFKTSLQEALRSVEDNKNELQKEMKDHIRYWKQRHQNNQSIFDNIELIKGNSIRSVKGDNLLQLEKPLPSNKKVFLLPIIKNKSS